MFIKDGKNYKLFYSNLSGDKIKRYNLINLVLSIAILVVFSAVCLIPQKDAVDYMVKNYGWFTSANVFAAFVPLVTALICFYCHFNAYKIRDKLYSNQLPKGLLGEKHTFSGLEIQMVVFVLFAVYEILLAVLYTSVLTVLCAVLALCLAAIAITIRMITYNAYKNLSEKQKVVELDDEIEEFYN